MSANSKYFDMVRIAPRKRRGTEQTRFVAEGAEPRVCEWEGCQKKADHRAPKIPGATGDAESYRWFCLEHVCLFNSSYNFFDGMSEDQILAFQEAARYGDRPTWDLRERAEHLGGWARASSRNGPFRDPYRFFKDSEKSRSKKKATGDEPARRAPRSLERAALDTLGLDETASLNEIKAKFKSLVKQHHPDANGGDRSSEERLRQVINAYDYLRKSGFC